MILRGTAFFGDEAGFLSESVVDLLMEWMEGMMYNRLKLYTVALTFMCVNGKDRGEIRTAN